MNTFTRWPSVDLSPTPTGWALPANLMPADVPRAWPRGRRATSEAEEILATAEAWWDVDRSGYRDGDRYLRNIGTAGSALDLRLGSSGVANSNDPKWLGPEDTGYCYLPGVAANVLSVPHETALQITGDIDLRARVALDSWTPTAYTGLVAKAASASTTNGYMLAVQTNGTLGLSFGTGVANGRNSTVAVGAAAGSVKWVRATLTVDNGATQNEARFYTSDDGTSWTQLGSTVTTAGIVAITTNTTVMGIGAGSGGTNYPMAGRMYRAQVLNGIGGSTVLDVDCDAITTGAATTFIATTSQTVTINRSTSGRKSVAMPSKAKGGRPCMLLGTDDYLECQDAAQHWLLNFYGADSFTVLACVRQWATAVANGYLVAKGSAATGVRWGIANDTAARYRYSDGTNSIALAGGSITSGTATTLAAIVNRPARLFTGYSDTTPTTTSIAGYGSFVSTSLLRVGASSEGLGNRQDFEFRAAAIWRRALTAREITVIANAAPWGV